MKKRDVDNFCKDRYLPKCDIYVIWKGGEVEPLPPKFQLNGGGPPNNYFRLLLIPHTSPGRV